MADGDLINLSAYRVSAIGVDFSVDQNGADEVISGFGGGCVTLRCIGLADIEETGFMLDWNRTAVAAQVGGWRGARPPTMVRPAAVKKGWSEGAGG